MKIYGTIGYPLTFSFSKQYFSEKIRKENIPNAAYHSFPLSNMEELADLLKNTPSLLGLAVTIPYKEKVLAYVTHVSEEVKQIGAANCIRIRGNEITAYNTDIIGFEKSFQKQLKPQHTKALVLGTGGASKAVQYVLQKMGIPFLLISRKEHIGTGYLSYHQITPEIIRDYKVIINATPVGMMPAADTCPELPYHLLTPDHYLFDLVYKPEETLFLQNGAAQGATVKNGFEMLILQAEENWIRWNTN